MTDIKISVVGNIAVGKTAAIFRYVEGRYQNTYAATVGIHYSEKKVSRNDQDYLVNIWDTAGQEVYRTIVKAYYRRSDGFILMFDITRRDTFSAISSWVTEIREHVDKAVPIVLVGNKTDLDDFRQVSMEEAREYAEAIGCQYFETSIKTDANITSVFDAVIDVILSQEYEENGDTSGTFETTTASKDSVTLSTETLSDDVAKKKKRNCWC